MIYVIFTGGTIGSRNYDDGTVGVDRKNSYRLIEMYRSFYGKDTLFKTYEPYRILSENLAANNLTKLIHTVNEISQKSDVDGIIITHGTDTLQYSAAILSYVFSAAQIPIMLVSSNYILDDFRANGLMNFAMAVRFIEEKRGNGVFVSYCNPGDAPTFHRGNRLQPSLDFSDCEYSVRNQWYGRYLGEVGDYVYEKNDNYVIDSENSDLTFKEKDKICLRESADEILWIRPYVGMRYPKLQENTKLVLLDSYHSGTIAVNDNLKQFVQETKDRNVNVYLTGLQSDATEYETIDLYRKLGIVPLYDSAAIAQYCKAWLLLSNDMDVDVYMRKPVGEER